MDWMDGWVCVQFQGFFFSRRLMEARRGGVNFCLVGQDFQIFWLIESQAATKASTWVLGDGEIREYALNLLMREL